MNDEELPLLLYGGEIDPMPVLGSDGKTYFVQLRRMRHEVPFHLTLKEFTKELYPGTQMAKSYKSLVTIDTKIGPREVLIYMNHPLRYNDYTLYQASYAVDQWGREYSTLAVVKNSGRVWPYVASGIVFLGLTIHFLGYAFKRRGARK
ncbi:MAG: cytochrome c biogenesis protein ResB [Candidatus Omnitrophota bacterium]